MNRSSLLFLACYAALSASRLEAQLDYAGGLSLQNFDTMGTTGTTAPVGWSFFDIAGANSLWTTSIAASGIVGGTANATLIATTTFASTSSATQGYNFALSTSTSDRALGTSPTGVAGSVFQLSLKNTSGASISSLALGYDIRRFTSVATANELPGFSLFYSLNNGTSWTNVSALTPTIGGPTGVIVPNTIGVTTVLSTPITLSSAWAANSTLLWRWVDDNAVATSPDQAYGLDNVAIGTLVGTAPTITLTSPSAGATFSSPATIPLTASASDSGGAIAKVEFFNGVTKLGQATSAPYSFSWTGVSSGTYLLTAVATDNSGNQRSTAINTVTVTAPPSSGTLSRGPYLQKAAPTQMTIRWRSSGSIAGKVNFGTSSGTLNQSVSESSAKTDHVVTLTGLSAGTTYFYSIGSAVDTLASGTDYTFTTPPVAGTQINTRLWVLGDAGTATAGQTAVRDAFYTSTGTRTPNLVLQLGDNAYNSGLDTEFQGAMFTMYASMLRKTPFWSCLGNHETNQATTFVDTYPYFDIYTFPTAGESGGVASGTEHYYSFDYGDVHFVSLDSMTASRSATGAMATWLQNDLTSTTATWVICFFHHPPYTKGSHDSDSETELIQMRQNILPILEEAGVDLVLCGHSHCYERSYLLDGHYGLSTTLTSSMKVNAGSGRPSGTGAYIKPLTGPQDHLGVLYAVAGSAGQATGGSLNHPAHFVSLNNLGSMILDITGNRLDATFLQSNGTTPDTFTILKQGAADHDKDGIPDEWELLYGLNRNDASDALLDSDGDGLTNLQEYQAGTNPMSTASAPQVSALTLQNDGSVTVGVSTVSGKTYRLEANDSFPGGAWLTVADNVAGTGAVVPVRDGGAATATNRVYRIVMLP